MTETYDILIIGSGPAGAAYARSIGDAAPEAKILMVEVGPRIPGARGEHTQNMSADDRDATQLLTQGPDAGMRRATALSDVAEGLDPSLEFRENVLPGLFLAGAPAELPEGEAGIPVASMSSGVGGMGIHWGASTPRPHQSERIPFISPEEMDAALAWAERMLAVTIPAVPGSGVSEAVRALIAEEFDGPGLTPTGFMPVAIQWPDGTPHFSGTGMILGVLEETVPGFELRAETLAKRVLIENGAVVGAVLEDRTTGEVTEVRAERVAVCADGLRTPQVLFASGVRPPALGHNLNEHFQVDAFGFLNDDLDPAAFENPVGDTGYILVPFSDARPMQGGIVLLAQSPFAGDLSGSPEYARFVAYAWYGAKDIRFEDRVEFSDIDSDFYGMPQMTLHYSHTDTDLQTIEILKANVRRSAARLSNLQAEPVLAAGGSSLHYQGTVRMGPVDDGQSVCDEYQQVWGVKGLYVGGNGVIPTSTAANPTLTTVALAGRTGARIAQQIRERQEVDA
ncbi:GMC oxidoreductase [Microbacterium aurum]